jgi:hypothetical protein
MGLFKVLPMKKIKKQFNRMTKLLNEVEPLLNPDQWEVIRDWFFVAGNAANDRLPKGKRFEKPATIIDHRKESL